MGSQTHVFALRIHQRCLCPLGAQVWVVQRNVRCHHLSISTDLSLNTFGKQLISLLFSNIVTPTTGGPDSRLVAVVALYKSEVERHVIQDKVFVLRHRIPGGKTASEGVLLNIL